SPSAALTPSIAAFLQGKIMILIMLVWIPSPAFAMASLQGNDGLYSTIVTRHSPLATRNCQSKTHNFFYSVVNT
ncbi:hypothetical protein K9N50_05660, partial [bacterium]|nr:hypothetical protein [bacterium]